MIKYMKTNSRTRVPTENGYMKIAEKIRMDRAALEKDGAITIVAFGDSVTHGALGAGEINYETVYWNLLRKKILAKRNYVPVNVINSGIGGVSAKGSLSRLESQALKYEPDLIIICFGLNDVNGELKDYLSAMREMFARCIERQVDVIFLTPNMLNTYVAADTHHAHLSYAKKMADVQNSGRMDDFVYGAISVAEEMGITVCDCYSKWKKLSETEDTTMLLANRINHPIKEMHELFAEELYKIILPNTAESGGTSSSTMYDGK